MIASVRVIRRRSQGRMRRSRNPSMTIWPAKVPVSVEDWPLASSATANSTRRERGAQQRRQHRLRLLDLGHDHVVLEEHRRGQHQNRGIHDQRAVQRDHGIEQIEAAGFAPVRDASPDAPRLHQRRMQIEIVRHHRRAQNADGDVQAGVVEPAAPGRRRPREARAVPKNSSTRKHPVMIAISDRMTASISRMP